MDADARKAIRFGRWYAAGSLACSAGMYFLFPRVLTGLIAIVVLLQGLAVGFLTSFWTDFETFASDRDWAAGHDWIEPPTHGQGTERPAP